MHQGQLQAGAAASGLSAEGIIQTLRSPGPPLMMPSSSPTSSSPCLLPPCTNGSSSSGGSSKTKASRSNSGGASRKRQSPICGAANASKRAHPCVLVAKEAVQLKDAGNVLNYMYIEVDNVALHINYHNVYMRFRIIVTNRVG